MSDINTICNDIGQSQAISGQQQLDIFIGQNSLDTKEPAPTSSSAATYSANLIETTKIRSKSSASIPDDTSSDLTKATTGATILFDERRCSSLIDQLLLEKPVSGQSCDNNSHHQVSGWSSHSLSHTPIKATGAGSKGSNYPLAGKTTYVMSEGNLMNSYRDTSPSSNPSAGLVGPRLSYLPDTNHNHSASDDKLLSIGSNLIDIDRSFDHLGSNGTANVASSLLFNNLSSPDIDNNNRVNIENGRSLGFGPSFFSSIPFRAFDTTMLHSHHMSPSLLERSDNAEVNLFSNIHDSYTSIGSPLSDPSFSAFGFGLQPQGGGSGESLQHQPANMTARNPKHTATNLNYESRPRHQYSSPMMRQTNHRQDAFHHQQQQSRLASYRMASQSSPVALAMASDTLAHSIGQMNQHHSMRTSSNVSRTDQFLNGSRRNKFSNVGNSRMIGSLSDREAGGGGGFIANSSDTSHLGTQVNDQSEYRSNDQSELETRLAEVISTADIKGRFSRKVFVGGLPPDIDEEEIKASFRRFGSLIVDWPHKAESKSYFPPKGYAFLLFQDEVSVQNLIDSCIHEDDKLYLCVSSPTIKDKLVQIRPWRLSDADYVMDSALALDPRKTVFVGGVPRPLKASELAIIMNNLYGGVCYAGIDTDPELKYPKGAGRVAFSNHQSYIAAISARFVHLHHSEIEKRVEVKPYVLDDQYCDECRGSRCGLKFAPFFCANVSCLRYYCDTCWSQVHSQAGREFHKPLVKEGADRPRVSPLKWS